MSHDEGPEEKCMSTWHFKLNSRGSWQLSNNSASCSEKYDSKRILVLEYNLMQKFSNFPETFQKSGAGWDSCFHLLQERYIYFKDIFLV